MARPDGKSFQVARTARACALLLLAVGAGLGATRELSAQQGGPDAAASSGPYRRHPEAQKAIDQIKSPYCIGFMLEVCSSSQGAALRDSIETLADQGWAADSIVDWVLANHGEQYLALPRREGKALIAWVVPPLAILIGFTMVIVALRQMRRSRAEPPPAHDLSSAEEEKLRQALRELEAEEDVPFI
jgi:cytochrome c-type biogenesis protein CcmH